MRIPTEKILTRAEVNERRLDSLLADELRHCPRKLVVLDDDPTGVQTVHDISVYTDWKVDHIRQGFQEENRLFYILTNSRGLTEKETVQIHREIARTVNQVARETGKEYCFISRSDSTLRGHYPTETQILKEEYEKDTGKTVDGEVLCPFFPEGGRFTAGNVHYVRYGEDLAPANETEFAQDKTFGYHAATLPEYVEEKTGGKFRKEDVVCFSIEELRSLDFSALEKKLLAVSGFQKMIVNAVEYSDLKIFCIALYRAMRKGKIFMFRSAAALVKVMGGVSDRPLLSGKELRGSAQGHGGLIIVGSHTEKTSRQLACLKELEDVLFVELDVEKVLDERQRQEEQARCLALEEEGIKSGRNVCCYTSRRLATAGTGDKEDELRLSVKISEAVCSLVSGLSVTPSFMIAKGGITSSDIGTKALQVKRAEVLGQIKPGIPVWKTGPESRFPGIPYVIFPGNVGNDETLKETVEAFQISF